MLHRTLLLSLAIISLPTQAYKVYKCEDEYGRPIFSQSRCTESRPKPVHLDPASGIESYGEKKSLVERAQNTRNFANGARKRSGGNVIRTNPTSNQVAAKNRKVQCGFTPKATRCAGTAQQRLWWPIWQQYHRKYPIHSPCDVSSLSLTTR